jgi:hypothetical protein
LFLQKILRGKITLIAICGKYKYGFFIKLPYDSKTNVSKWIATGMDSNVGPSTNRSIKSANRHINVPRIPMYLLNV